MGSAEISFTVRALLPTQTEQWIGEVCTQHAECSSGECLTFTSSNAPLEGMCSLECTRLCPDATGKTETFCVTFDVTTGGFSGHDGRCFIRCDIGQFPLSGGCRPGFECIKMSRHNQSEVKGNVCLPSQLTGGQVGTDPDEKGDALIPEGHLEEPSNGGGCAQVSTRSSAGALPGELLCLALFALLFSAIRRSRLRG